MKESLKILEKTMLDNPALQTCSDDLQRAYEIIMECYRNGGMVLVCGNGGSAADSEHIVGELMKGFLKKRPLPKEDRDLLEDEYLYGNLQGTLPAISLVSQTSIATAFMNDVEPDMVFAQQVYGYRNRDSVLIAISTSGNAANVNNAVRVANAFGMKTIGMTGRNGGKLLDNCTVTIKAPATETYRIQEYHLPIYHALCAMVEADKFEV
ncbi:MAG: SIS domain-containing protein [Clostridia bacterium]|nr:SIS domain-containing protein [Clostridia bacterium]MBN2883219.1 SIS domain-containing protein [Clostridia bacterium]